LVLHVTRSFLPLARVLLVRHRQPSLVEGSGFGIGLGGRGGTPPVQLMMLAKP